MATTTGARRTAGLRREEVAVLAGISVDYYTRIEQGRERRPSRGVLDSLSDALHLPADDRRHLHDLAAAIAHPPADGAPVPVTEVRPAITAILASVRPSPAYVVNRIGDMIDANPEGINLFHGIADYPPGERNTVRYTFTHPRARTLFVDWDEAARSSVAQLRAANAAWPDDRYLTALVDQVGAEAPEFRSLWEQHAVGRRRHTIKRFRHPDLGAVEFDFETMHLPDDQLRMSIYTSPRPLT